MANGTSEAPASVQSVDRALTILGILARLGEAGVTEIAAELRVHKSTAFRLVATLESHGVVQEARPICRKLAADSGETVNIAVLSDRSALYLDQVAGQSALQSHNWVGQHIPLHATSNGKVLLSGLSSDEVDSRLPRLPSYTTDTVTSRARLRRELAEVRDQGYAVAVDELEVGLTAIAAPIRNAHGDVIASLSVSGPTFRLGEPRVKELVPVVQDAADEVSRRLGYGTS